MKRYFLYFIILLAFGCNEPIVKKEYYVSGELKSEITLDKERNRDGFTFTYYKNGKIKDKALYKSGHIIDTVYGYNEDGTLNNKEFYSRDSTYNILYKHGSVIRRGAFKKTVLNGWIEDYKNGKLLNKKIVLTIFGQKSPHINSSIVYNNLGDTVKEKSFFHKLITPDTVFVNQYNVGEVLFNSDKATVNRLRNRSLIIIIGEDITEKYDNLKRLPLDSFTNNNKFAFKFTRTGKQKLRGKFIEEVLITTEDKKDNENVNVQLFEREFYFEKDVYVKTNNNVP